MHELPHHWDGARNDDLSRGMASEVAAHRERGERSVSSVGRTLGAGEDWAEAVAYAIYPDAPRFDNFSPTRWRYVWGAFQGVSGTVQP